MSRNMINSQNNGFILRLPKTFITKEIAAKYEEVLFRLPTPYKTVLDYLNATIQSITFPSISMDNVEQTYKHGDGFDLKNSVLFEELFDNDISITFKSTDGYLNYWMVYDIVKNYIQWSQVEKYMGNLIITNINAQGYSYANIHLNMLTFTSLSVGEFNFTETTSNLENFELGLKFNHISIDTLKSDKDDAFTDLRDDNDC